jgi:hypothetical protein
MAFAGSHSHATLAAALISKLVEDLDLNSIDSTALLEFQVSSSQLE